jgi:hypothetical protein
MSEKMYIRLLRLYPPSFRNEYEGEALQLIRDRLRDEIGFFKRARLWWDLVADVFAGLPRAYLNSYAMPEAAPHSLNAEGIPSFKVLDKGPLGRGSILFGGTLSMIAISAFGFVVSRPIPYPSPSDTNARMSPIETVIERLNRAVDPDALVGGDRNAANKSVSGGTGEPQARSSAATEVSASNPSKSALLAEGRSGAGERDRVVSIQARNVNARSVGWPMVQRAFKTASQSVSQRDLSANGNAVAKGVTLALRSGNRDSNTVPEHGQAPIPAEQPMLENADSAMIQSFHSHDIVMLGEVHDNEQEYEWLCMLVKRPGFSDQVDDIVVEFGNGLYQKTVDRYVAGEDVQFDEVQQAWRNMVADTEPVSPVYGWLYKAVRDANLRRPGKRGIRLLMGSPPSDWSKIKNSADLAPFESEREQWYAQVVKTEVLAKHHHALLIMGAGHFLRGHDQALQFELAAQQHQNVPLDKTHLGPGYIERELRAAGANPYLVVFGTNVIDNRGDVDRRFDSWPVPVMVPLSGNWVGALPAQSVISGGHAPAIPLTLADQADALLYLAPCSVLRMVYPSHAELDGTAYEQEMIRRDIILLGHPVTFPFGMVPQCVQPQEASR